MRLSSTFVLAVLLCPLVVWATAIPPAAELHGTLEFTARPGGEGFGLVLAPAGETPAPAAWHEPNVPGAVAFGFDMSDPPTSDWFDAHGNFYDRPQRQVSLHWDGREMANALAPVDFADGRDVAFSFQVRWDAVGAWVDATMDGAPVFDSAWIPWARPYRLAPALGGTGDTVTIAGIGLDADGDPPPTPRVTADVVLFHDAIVHAQARNTTRTATLPEREFARRYLLELELGPAPGGCDPWDKSGAIYCYDASGERFEVARFITPFGRPAAWTWDVTELAPLLTGDVLFELYIDTWMEKKADPAEQLGWTANARLRVVEDPSAPYAVAVRNVWNGKAPIDDPQQPGGDFFRPAEFELPPGTGRGVLRLTVTGHGAFGEFVPSRRTVTVNGRAYDAPLWVDDCWLNPLRPQGGTWKFDRAGWCPGSKVEPWRIPWTLDEGYNVLLDYRCEPYARRELLPAEDWSHYWVGSQVVFY